MFLSTDLFIFDCITNDLPLITYYDPSLYMKLRNKWNIPNLFKYYIIY